MLNWLLKNLIKLQVFKINYGNQIILDFSPAKVTIALRLLKRMLRKRKVRFIAVIFYRTKTALPQWRGDLTCCLLTTKHGILVGIN